MPDQAEEPGNELLDSAAIFSQLADNLEKFVLAWETEQAPPGIEDYLPQNKRQRRIVLVELIKADLEFRWLVFTFPKRLADYLTEWPELTEHRLSVDLIYEEFHIRKQAGIAVSPEDYAQEYPEHVDELNCLLGMNDEYVSTCLYDKENNDHLDEISSGLRLDDFDLLTELGRGAFAKVFLARQNSMERLVALKVSANRGTEPQTLAQLDHDYIIRVFDLRLLEKRDLRLMYMQYVAGGTMEGVAKEVRLAGDEKRTGALLLKAVDQALENRGEVRPVESSIRKHHLSATWPETVCWLGARLARALEYAHARGVLHRDVKPANVLLTAEGVPKLADFNISFCSKLTGATPAAYFGGSLAYMSPEQLEACNPLHPRAAESLEGISDFYSLGILLWELLTGHRPFKDDTSSGDWPKILNSMIEVRQAGLTEEIYLQLPHDVPEGLRRVLKTSLQPDSEQRWSTGSEFSRQLELCTNPIAENLLYPPPSSIRQRIKPFSTLWVIILALIPNALAAWFNLVYNKREFDQLGPFFDHLQMTINGIAFPCGIGMIGWLAWSVCQGDNTHQTSNNTHANNQQISRLKKCLRLGHYAAIICLAEWILAGLAYPISLHFLEGSMTVAHGIHFFSGLAICGMIAAAYPFFLITHFALNVLLPGLQPLRVQTEIFSKELQMVNQWAWVYLISAAAVPMLGISVLIRIESDARFALEALSGCGLVGLAGLFYLFRQIQNCISALTEILSDE